MSNFEKLINASDLIEWIIETDPDWCVGSVRSIIDHIDKLPSAESEIIRCRDCKYASSNGVYGCILERFSAHDESTRLFANDYCSAAERRTDDGE